MKPYYKSGGVTIYNCDSREILREFGHKQFDLAIWDPPYNCGTPYDLWNDKLPEDEYRSAMRQIANECSFVSINQVCMAPRTHLAFFLSILPNSQLVVIRRPVIGPLKAGWFDDYGIALATGLPRLPISDLWDDVDRGGEDNFGHPGYTPASIINRFVRLYAKTSLIDPCCGTGTSLVAAKRLGLSAVGIEISEKYCEIAAKRLSQGVSEAIA